MDGTRSTPLWTAVFALRSAPPESTPSLSTHRRQGNSVNFGSFVDNSGVSQALVYFKTNGGAEAYWDSNDFTFGTGAYAGGVGG